jgi:copper resistance protein B
MLLSTTTAHAEMDHSHMHHGDMHGMDHSTHAADTTPDESGLRDPHAYAEGYGFGDLEHPKMGDEENFASLIVDRLESQISDSGAGITYDAQAWYGKTYDRLVLRVEGRGSHDDIDDARNEILWGHALTPFWDSHLGLRYDAGIGTDRPWFAFGFQGLAPYWIYVEATGYIGEEGRAAFRLETEYDILLSQKLYLQPRLEVNIYSQNDKSRAVSAGLSDIEAGVRLHYEIVREFAPYVGVEWDARFGTAADAMAAQGVSTEVLQLVAGVKFWF